MRILVKANNWLGDAVMSLPALASLRAMHPGAYIAVLTKQSFADLYRAVPAVDEVIPYTRQQGARRIGGGFKLAASLRRGRFDMALLFPRSLSAAMLAVAAGIPRRIGYGGGGRTALLTDPVTRRPEDATSHRVLSLHHLLTPLGTPPRPKPPTLKLPDEDVAWAAATLPRKRPIVVVNPGATYGHAKQWGTDRFGEVARKLAIDFKASILLIGGPAERSTAATVALQVPDALNLAGRTTILQLAAILKASDLLLTNDTGPMHVADAVGTRIVALFGPTDPVTTPPFGRTHTIIRKPMECSPCLKRECPLLHHHCMKWITPEEVIRACAQFLTP